MAYIGLSLSMCVTDIAKGVIPLDEVIGIRANTAVYGEDRWRQLMQEYRASYWAFDPDRCEAIARRLWEAEGIIQPRLDDQPAHSIAAGHWEKDGVLVPDAELRAMYHDADRRSQSAPATPDL